MRIKLFTVPLLESDQGEQEINNFCAAHSIATIEKHFVADGHNSFWAFCVTYASSGAQPAVAAKGKIDYKAVLNDQDFQLFVKLRELRKALAEKDGVPAYALFTNEQLAAIATKKITSKSALAAIDGVGPGRIEKYGEQFVNVVCRAVGTADGAKVEEGGDEASPA